MSYNDFMTKVRQWDNLTAKWLMRHFYFMFFQFVLVVIFIFWFINALSLINLSFDIHKSSLLEQLMLNQSVHMSIVVLLILLNSFWMLFIFNSLQGLRNILKDISFNTTKRYSKD